MSFFGIDIKINIIITTVLVILLSIFLLSPLEQKVSENYNIKKLRQEANVSFQVPSPGKSQIQEIMDNKNIEAVFPYYDLFTDVSLKNKKLLSEHYVMLITSSQVGTFPFVQESMFVKKGNIDAKKPLTFIDYSFARKYGLSVGKEIGLNIGSISLTAPIAAITYNINRLLHIREGDGTEGMLIISIPESFVSNLEESVGRTIQFGGAYIRTKNISAVKSYLTDYKPLGRLKGRSLFATDGEYIKYLNDFNGTSYSAEIRDLSNIFNSSSSLYIVEVFPILLLTVLLLFALLFFNFNSQKFIAIANENIKNGGSIKDILNSIKTYLIFFSIYIIILYFVLFCIIIKLDNTYYPIISSLPFFLLFSIIYVLLVIILARLYLIYYEKSLNKQIAKVNPEDVGEDRENT